MKIDSIALNPGAPRTKSGARVVATFTARIHDVTCRDLMFVILPSGTPTVWSAKSKRDNGPVVMFPQSMRDEMVATVSEYLGQLGVAA